MFGIDGIEFLIILIVIIVVVGPKDLPKMMRAFGQATARMRRTAAQFRRHFDEAMREAELDDLADTVKGVTKLDPRKKLTEIFDPLRDVTGDIKKSLQDQVAASQIEQTPIQEIESAPELAQKPAQEMVENSPQSQKNKSKNKSGVLSDLSVDKPSRKNAKTLPRKRKQRTKLNESANSAEKTNKVEEVRH